MSVLNPPVSLGQTTDATDQTNYTHNITAAVPAGARVIVAAGWASDTTAQTPTVTGGGLTWNEDKRTAGANGSVQNAVTVWSADAPAGLANGTTLTLALASGAVTTFSCTFGAAYLTGVRPGSLGVDTTTGQIRTAPNTTWSSTALTTTSPDVALICAVQHDAASAITSTPIGGEIWDADSADNVGCCLNYRVQPGLPGSYTFVGAWNSSPVTDCSACVAYAGDDLPPTFVSKGTVAATANSVADPTALVPGQPASTVNGDLLLAVTSSRSNTATCATPAGYTVWPGLPVASGTGSGGKIYVFYRFVDGSESAPTLTWTGLATGTSGDSAQAVILAYRHVDLNASAATVATGTDAAITNTATCAALTTLFDDALKVDITTKINDTAHTWTPSSFGPLSWAERNDTHTTTGTGSSLHVQDLLIAAAGAVGTSTIAPSTTTSSRALSISLALAGRRPRPRQAMSVVQAQQAAV